jgi:hypothetical protein
MGVPPYFWFMARFWIAWLPASGSPNSQCLHVLLYCPSCTVAVLPRRYVFAFQMPWVAEAALCANDYAMLAGMLTGAELGCTTPGAIPPQASASAAAAAAASFWGLASCCVAATDLAGLWLKGVGGHF